MSHSPSSPVDGRLAQERFRTAFEHAVIGMTMTGLDGRFIAANPAFCDCVGYDEVDLLAGMTFHDLTDPGDGELDTAALLSGRSELVRGERRYLRRDGALVLADVCVSLVREDDGAPVHFLTQVMDVTEQRRTALELRRSNAELQHFASTASHDLNEPLRIVDGYLQLLTRRYAGELDEEALEFIGYAVGAAGRMRGLIDALLHYARIGASEPVLQHVDSAQLAREAADALRVAIGERAVALDIADLPAVDADPTLLRQVFQNLLANAVRFAGPDAPHVHVTAARHHGVVEFSVADNGAGIAPGDRERIFEMFQRGRGADAEDARCAGIGLAICKRAIERHGGRIWVHDAPGRGADVRFTIPIHQSARAAA